MKVHVLGGFLGAGKTTAVRALARLLGARGERVAVVTNDQGEALVDTALLRGEDVAAVVSEVGGGCFCCCYGDLAQALDAARAAGATVALAEAVGSCTDLVATVLSPLADEAGARDKIAPLSVLVDPWRVLDVAAGKLPQEVAYLFGKQIEEADVLVLTRADLAEVPDVEPFLRGLRPDVPIVRVSGVTGQGVAEWLATVPDTLSRPLEIDYDRYAAAEALLGWANGRVTVRATTPFAPLAVVERFFALLAVESVAHVKVHVEHPAMGGASLTRQGTAVRIELGALPEVTNELRLLVNARVALGAEVLEQRLRAAMAEAAPGATVEWQGLKSFQPARPVPVHRYAARCDPDSDASCCAAFYERPDVRYLLGDSYHPGGPKLTLELAEHLGLSSGVRLLDVACGAGTSLRTILERHDITCVGLDASPPEEHGTDRLAFHRADAHDIPFAAHTFDAVLCECALSTFTAQARALAEIFRVLRPGGRLAISDMVVDGALPASLAEWVRVGTCLAHARALDDYAALLRHAGFEITVVQNATWALEDLLRQVKGKLVQAALGRAAGVLGADAALDLPRGREALRAAQGAVREGRVGYGYVVAKKPENA